MSCRGNVSLRTEVLYAEERHDQVVMYSSKNKVDCGDGLLFFGMKIETRRMKRSDERCVKKQFGRQKRYRVPKSIFKGPGRNADRRKKDDTLTGQNKLLLLMRVFQGYACVSSL